MDGNAVPYGLNPCDAASSQVTSCTLAKKLTILLLAKNLEMLRFYQHNFLSLDFLWLWTWGLPDLIRLCSALEKGRRRTQAASLIDWQHSSFSEDWDMDRGKLFLRWDKARGSFRTINNFWSISYWRQCFLVIQPWILCQMWYRLKTK